MYKKVLVIVLSISMILGLSGCGCGQKKTDEVTVSAEVESKNTELELAKVETEIGAEVDGILGAEYNPDDFMPDLDEVSVNEVLTPSSDEERVPIIQEEPVTVEAEPESIVTEENIMEETVEEGTQVAEENVDTDETPAEEETEQNQSASVGHVSTEYEKYLNMSGAEQKAYMESFDSVEAFFDWLNAAKEEHERLNPAIEITGNTIDLNEVLGGE